MKIHWLDKSAYPFQPHYFDNKGHRLHYIDEGKGETLLFVHGTPSWSFDFRNVIKKLKKGYRCIAIDHIGFGLSDKSKDYDYSTLNHSHTLEKFVEEKQLNSLTLVVHDFGGPIGLHFAMRHPEKVKRLVILNSWLWSSQADPDFIKFSKVLKSPLLPFLYRYFNFSARFLLPRSFGDHKISKHILSQYTKPFGSVQERNGTIAFARSLLNDQDWFETLWTNKSSINNKPTLFIWGMKDKFVKPRYLDKFLTGFPNATVHRLPTSGHFPQEEQPDLVAQYIEDFMRE